MLKTQDPDAWHIHVVKTDAGYVLNYKECFEDTDENYNMAKKTVDAVSVNPLFSNIRLERVYGLIELSFQYTGEKQLIIDMLAGEFLLCSTVSKISIADLLTKTAVLNLRLHDLHKKVIENNNKK
jgi:hypothetical protein